METIFADLMRETEIYFGIPVDSEEAFAKLEQMINEQYGSDQYDTNEFTS